MSQMVQNVELNKVQVSDTFKISRDRKTMNIVTKEERKFEQIVYTKRVLLENYDTVPYGY